MNRQMVLEKPPGEPKRLSLRVNFSWTFLGMVFRQVSAVLVLMLLAKWGSEELVGTYSLGLALVAPVLAFSDLELGGLLITDQSPTVPYGRFVALRIIGTLAALVVIAGIIFFQQSHEPFNTRIVLILVSAGGCVTAMRDIFLAIMRRYERMDLSGIAEMLAGVVPCVAFAGIFYFLRSFPLSMLALLVGRLAMMLIYDIPSCQRMVTHTPGASMRPDWAIRPLVALVGSATPLALARMANMISVNLPRYFLDGFYGKRELGYFSAMAFFATAALLLANTLGTAALPRLAYCFARDRCGFRYILKRMMGVAIVLGGSAIGIGYLLGPWLLTVFFRPDYASYGDDFVLMMVALTLQFVVSFLNQALVASRAFRNLVLVNWVNLAFGTFVFWVFVKSAGIRGACIGLIVSNAFWILILWLVLRWWLRHVPVETEG